MKKRIVIIGGGFGGLSAAKSLKNADVDITLIDKTNHHVFQPLLYQVATAALSPADIAAPIRAILRNQKNVRVIMGEVKKIDKVKRKVHLIDSYYDYDYLILSIGNNCSYFGNDKWAENAPGLKSISDALKIRERILLSFEKAEQLDDPKEIDKFLTFVIVGGGPTGVELAGAISEIARKTMLKDFRKIDPSKTRIILVEASNRLLSSFDPKLSNHAKKDLEDLGVTVMLSNKVTTINESGVVLNDKFIETKNVIWAAGNTVHPLLKDLESDRDNAGRIIVDMDCSIKNDPNIFVIGDAALFLVNGKPLPEIAPVAIQQGRFVAKIISNNLDKKKRPVFKYFDKGTMATIGKAKAIAQIWGLKISGLSAWLIWGFIHILYLIGMRNRYRVMAEWIWLYITNRNGIRLITQKLDF